MINVSYVSVSVNDFDSLATDDWNSADVRSCSKRQTCRANKNQETQMSL